MLFKFNVQSCSNLTIALKYKELHKLNWNYVITNGKKFDLYYPLLFKSLVSTVLKGQGCVYLIKIQQIQEYHEVLLQFKIKFIPLMAKVLLLNAENRSDTFLGLFDE